MLDIASCFFLSVDSLAVLTRNGQADRMLDMGFIDSVKALISKMPKANGTIGTIRVDVSSLRLLCNALAASRCRLVSWTLSFCGALFGSHVVVRAACGEASDVYVQSSPEKNNRTS